MSEHRAGCRCGAVTIACRGAPLRVSACHCCNCQARSGSAFAAQARFAADQVTITGDTREWTKAGDEGGVARNRWCPSCGVLAYYLLDREPGVVAVPLGLFADPAALGPPLYSVYESRKLPWVEIVGDGIDHFD